MAFIVQRTSKRYKKMHFDLLIFTFSLDLATQPAVASCWSAWKACQMLFVKFFRRWAIDNTT